MVLSNGNYVVRSYYWDNEGTLDVGAVTWGSGAIGISGVVNSNNSLVGSASGDLVGYGGVTPLINGNYVVSSPNWDSSGASDVGAVTWGSGSSGVFGLVSGTNSLIGSSANDAVGFGGVSNLSNGNYVVRSPFWDHGGANDVGAVTWGSGESGVAGEVNITNSLVGATPLDQIGWNPIVALPGSLPGENGGFSSSGWLDGLIPLTNGNYLVYSPTWDNGEISDAGAVTWADGGIGVSGTISAENSMRGMVANAGNPIANSILLELIAGKIFLSFGNSDRLHVGYEEAGFRVRGKLESHVAPLNLRAAELELQNTASSLTNVSILPTQSNRPIDLGSETAGKLSITDSEIDHVLAPSILIGDVNSGPVTISAPITRSTATNLSISSGGNITFSNGSLDTAGGSLTLSAGINGQIKPNTAGVDLTASSVQFDADDRLDIAIQGTIVDTEYTQ